MLQKVIDLINNWKEFAESSPNLDFVSFGKWLSAKYEKDDFENASPIINTGKHLTEEYSGNQQFLASYYLNRMNKFIKIYTKNIFQRIGLHGAEDFSFLALIHQLNNPSKKELCDKNLTEFSTGLDIIRRLIKSELVNEIIDLNDKRTKRLEITDKGLEVVNRAYIELNLMQEDVLGDLSDDERYLIIKFLARLNTYHTSYLNKL